MPDTDPTPQPAPAKGALRSYRGGRPKGVRNRPPPTHIEPEWARGPETAARFRISHTKLKAWQRAGEVNSQKHGNIRLYEIASVRQRVAGGEA
jgi:hypothetical protein